MRSGTSGSAITAVCGSGRGTSGTETRPAPSLLRLDEPADAPELRTETERDEARPDRDRESRPDTDLRDVDDRADDLADLDDVPEPPRAEALLEPTLLPARPPPAIPVGGELTSPLGDTTGARPHVPQYSSPPPMSS